MIYSNNFHFPDLKSEHLEALRVAIQLEYDGYVRNVQVGFLKTPGDVGIDCYIIPENGSNIIMSLTAYIFGYYAGLQSQMFQISSRS